MVIPYRTAKIKSANILVIAIRVSPPNLIPASISGYMVSYLEYWAMSGLVTRLKEKSILISGGLPSFNSEEENHDNVHVKI